MSLGSDFVCVVQLTDSHLFADAEGDLLGLQTQASLDAVVDMVLEQISRMDLVLASGLPSRAISSASSWLPGIQ